MSAGPVSVGGVAEITVEHDVQRELGLRPAALMTLEMIATAGGEVPFDWNRISPASQELVADMIERGLITGVELVLRDLGTSAGTRLRITERGGNVLDEHRRRRLRVGEIKPLEADPR